MLIKSHQFHNIKSNIIFHFYKVNLVAILNQLIIIIRIWLRRRSTELGSVQYSGKMIFYSNGWVRNTIKILNVHFPIQCNHISFLSKAKTLIIIFLRSRDHQWYSSPSLLFRVKIPCNFYYNKQEICRLKNTFYNNSW